MTKTFWDPNLYNAKHDYVARFGADLLSLLNPKNNERILDLGCGTGVLTNEIAKSGAHVIGIDNSPEMINQACKDFPDIIFKVEDAQNFHFDEPFDAVFSNAALHWMHKPKNVIACVWNCLKNKGRFVFEMGGKNNIKQVLNAIAQTAKQFNISDLALLNYFPSLGEYSSLLEVQGFRVLYAETSDRPTALQGPEGLRNWIRMFRNQVLQQLPETQHEAFFQSVENAARSQLFHKNQWWVDYVRLRVIAHKIVD